MKIAFSKIFPLWYHGKYDNLQWKSWNIHQERICKQATYLKMNMAHTQHIGQLNTLFILHTSYMCIKVKWKLVFCNFMKFISDSVKIFKFQLKNVKVSNCYFSYLSKGFLSNAINWVIEWSREGLTDWPIDWLIDLGIFLFSFSL